MSKGFYGVQKIIQQLKKINSNKQKKCKCFFQSGCFTNPTVESTLHSIRDKYNIGKDFCFDVYVLVISSFNKWKR